jgi:competence protein ComFA
MPLYFMWAAEQGITPPGGSYLPASVRRKRPGNHLVYCGITPEPAIELSLLMADPLYLLSAELPLWLAQMLLPKIRSCFGHPVVGWWGRLHLQAQVMLLRRRINSQLLTWEYQRRPTVSILRRTDVLLGESEYSKTLPAPHLVEAVLEVLQARRLLERELARALEQTGVVYPGQLHELLHYLVLDHILRRESVIALNPYGRPQCRRCGSERIHWTWCAKCGSLCPFCGDCRNMGVARGCDALYSLTELMKDQTARHNRAAPQINLPFSLSPAQSRASAQIASAIQQGVRELTVWAACGAGKTEVVYAAMRDTVGQGKRVLLLTPRRDVTAELYARLQGVFGEEYVIGLYGAAEPTYQAPPIIVATTHQAIRLDGSFGLVVLDECDAFPYRTEKTLQSAVARLVQQGGCFIQMTATPGPVLRRNKHDLIYIPARHHGYPLPVPLILQDASLRPWRTMMETTLSSSPCPDSVVEALIQSRREQAQLLLFVPRRRLVSPLVQALQQVGIEQVAGVHSGSKDRDEIRTAFRAGQLEVVVATTVFERGLTFPQVNVAVFLAETRNVFDAATLVQMAGRVGRTTTRPQGTVWFTCGQPNQVMRQAISDITTLNEIAAREGLLLSSG